MKPEYFVEMERFSELREIAGVWTAENFIEILESLEYGDTSDIEGKELREMCLMSLQDLAPARPLKYVCTCI
jgi:hypothetical protein